MAKTSGAIITRYMLPGFASYIIVSLTISIPGMILGETSLSFLGIGLRAPTISWGVMLQDAQNLQAISQLPWLLWPCAFVVVAVLMFNFLGDGLRDAADPYVTLKRYPMPATNEHPVEIKDLHTYFYLAEGVVQAVDGVDLTINRREDPGHRGRKRLRQEHHRRFLMLRLVPPPGKIEGGEILFYRTPQGRQDPRQAEVVNMTKLDPKGKEIRDIRGNQISMVFQEPMTAMSPVRTIGPADHRSHHPAPEGRAKQKRANSAIEMLARVRMSKPERVIDDYPFQLSGGMRQRAVIAMALSCQPSLLIADEPTTALDVTTEAQILNLMRDLQEEFGMAIMYITHNLGVIAEMADEVAVMYMGKVVEQTDVKSIFYNPLHPYTRGCSNPFRSSRMSLHATSTNAGCKRSKAWSPIHTRG